MGLAPQFTSFLVWLCSSSFEGLPSLEKLFLMGSKVTYIGEATFAGLPALRTLSMEGGLVTCTSECCILRG